MRKLFLAFVFLYFVVISCQAAITDIGVRPLILERGARSLGMGGAFVAISGDVYCQLYNPAGLIAASGLALSTRGPNGLSVLQASPNGPEAAFGFGFFTSRITGLSYNSGTANTNGNIASLSYATKLPMNKKLSVGVTGKGIIRQSFERSASFDTVGRGWDLDVGLLWEGGDWWQLGLAAMNVLPQNTLSGSVLDWDAEVDEGLPFLLRLGGAAKVMAKNLLLAGELEYARNEPSRYRVGVEYNFLQRILLRAGYIQRYNGLTLATVATYSGGIGLKIGEIMFDLASHVEPLQAKRLLIISATYSPRSWFEIRKEKQAEGRFVMQRLIEALSIQNNIVTTNESLAVSGKVKKGVTVFINKQSVFLAEDGQFKALLPLSLGKNKVSLEFKYQQHSQLDQYIVTRQPKAVEGIK